jgi:hypothetical protein
MAERFVSSRDADSDTTSSQTIQEVLEFHFGFQSNREISYPAFTFHQSSTKALQEEPTSTDRQAEVWETAKVVLHKDAMVPVQSEGKS